MAGAALGLRRREMLGRKDSPWLPWAASWPCRAAGVGALWEGVGRYPGQAGVLGGQAHPTARGELGWSSPGGHADGVGGLSVPQSVPAKLDRGRRLRASLGLWQK